MRRILVISFVIGLFFTACQEEEEVGPVPINYVFSCKIDGIDFTDNNPLAFVSQNVLTIDASNGNNSIRIIIYNFSNRIEGEEIELNNLTDKLYVTLDLASYTNTTSGVLSFSELGNLISGTFNAQCNNLQTFQSVIVTEGKFIQISL